MARVYEFEGVVPVIDPTAFVHPEAVIIGDVIIGAGCYIAPFASLRGDFGRIMIGERVNVQDSCTVHVYPEKLALIEADAHIGHGAILHGCIVRHGALIGMNSVVMDGATVGEDAFVGAFSFVRANFTVPPRCLAVGNPAELVRDLTEQEIAWKASGTSVYALLAQRCRRSLKPAQPLSVLPPDRKGPAWNAAATAPLHERKGPGS